MANRLEADIVVGKNQAARQISPKQKFSLKKASSSGDAFLNSSFALKGNEIGPFSQMVKLFTPSSETFSPTVGFRITRIAKKIHRTPPKNTLD